MCNDIRKEIVELFQAKKRFMQGVVGPSGLGKSYAFLHNYLVYRTHTKKKILFINNPVQLIEDAPYIARQLIFCFADFLHAHVGETKCYSKSPVCKIDFKRCKSRLSKILKNPLLTEMGVFKLLWAFYLSVITDNLVDWIILLKVLQKLKEFCASRSKKFVLFFYQLDVLTRPDPIPEEYREKWWSDIIRSKKCFHKTFWVASENNDFVRPPTYFKQLKAYFDEPQLRLALKHYIWLLTDKNAQTIWMKKEKMNENIKF